MEPTKKELRVAKRAVKKEQRQAKKAFIQQSREGFDAAVLAKVEELKSQE